MVRTACSLALALVLSAVGSTAALAVTDGTSNTLQITEAAGACSASFTAGVGSTKGSFTVQAGATKGSVRASAAEKGVSFNFTKVEFSFVPGHDDAWAAISIEDHIDMYGVAELDAGGTRRGRLVATLPVGDDFRPESLRLGIIAMLIDLVQQPAPAIWFQDGDQMRLYVFDGGGFRLLAQQPATSKVTMITFNDVLVSSWMFPGNETRTCSLPE
jgi:hypothetical protein